LSWFLYMVWDKSPISFFTFGYSVSPIPFIEETVLFSLCVLGTFDENQLIINIWVYFWVFYSVPLVSVFMPVPSFFDHNSFLIHFEVKECDASRFVCFAQDCFGYSRSFVVPPVLLDYFSISMKNDIGSLKGHSIYRLLWII
jgi:hypothetical protein